MNITSFTIAPSLALSPTTYFSIALLALHYVSKKLEHPFIWVINCRRRQENKSGRFGDN